ncbi:MAG: hypothetical protein P8166_01845 [Candidatus Thiodiazotropha sp.]
MLIIFIRKKIEAVSWLLHDQTEIGWVCSSLVGSLFEQKRTSAGLGLYFGSRQTSGLAVYDSRNQAKADFTTESIESDPIDSCAVISRPASKDFAHYHDKAMPLMLPGDAAVVQAWFDPGTEQSPVIADRFENPVVTPQLSVKQVITFKYAEVIAGSVGGL